jgi:hypothetical protein
MDRKWMDQRSIHPLKKILFYCQFWSILALFLLYCVVGGCLFECGQQTLQDDLKFANSEIDKVKISENNN